MCGFAVYTGSDPLLRLNVARDFFKVKYRGPDNTTTTDFGNKGWMGCHRLKIVDVSDRGNQPLIHDNHYLLCNGEVYNYLELRDRYTDSYNFKSDSDCEAIIPLILDKGIEAACRELDSEFVFVFYDGNNDNYMAARDPVGIRPMFYGYSEKGEIMFASEMKALQDLCKEIKPFPPGYYYDGKEFHQYRDISRIDSYSDDEPEEVFKNINKLLTAGVKKRLAADVPVGFLCNGELDSSLICAIAARMLDKPIRTFAVAIEDNPSDTKYAGIVAEYLNADHTEVLFSRQDIFDTLNTLIYNIESYDITTIRESLGMYIVCKYISENTDIKVILTGEISDEIFGYKYVDYAPGPEALQKEAEKRLRKIHMYDVLRADRTISSNGLEARLPFGDLDFLEYVMRIQPEKKMNFTGIGKYILRKSFEGGYLPHHILYREKAAFSDSVGHSIAGYLKDYAEKAYSDKDLVIAQIKYKHAPPVSKESLMYREIFERHFPGRANIIKDFRMSTREWSNCNVNDPDARVLPNYGKSEE